MILLNKIDYSKLTVKEMTLEERPREKLIMNGVKSLSNAELLAVILRTGSKNKNAIELSSHIINLDKHGSGIKNLEYMTIEELCEIDGIGMSKAAQIKASLELGVRISSFKRIKQKIVKPVDVYKYFFSAMRYLEKEIFKVILLNTKNEIISDIDISIGTLNSTLVHPREVFKEAIRRSSNNIILIHNHPSGDVKPSKEDGNITKRLVECGKIIGIQILDHIIVGEEKYFSFKENMLI